MSCRKTSGRESGPMFLRATNNHITVSSVGRLLSGAVLISGAKIRHVWSAWIIRMKRKMTTHQLSSIYQRHGVPRMFDGTCAIVAGVAKYFFGVLACMGVFSRAWADGAQIIGAGPSGECRMQGSPGKGNFLPGKHYEEAAKHYLDKDDITGALEAFEHAAYYGNRDAQYDMAMMYLNGAKKIPVDVPLGIAWLRMASRYGQPLSIIALQKLETALTSEQRDASARHFQKLEKKYDVSITRRRVFHAYQRERGLSGFAYWVCREGGAVPADTYLAEIEQQYTDYVTAMYGTVTVEPLQPISNSSEKNRNRKLRVTMVEVLRR
jgi:hypothetical protein